ncbi:MAG: [protein-PII] uridylyltransferase, partial [Rhodobacteraceae bacterium]|nr:[protein-PII] uridylyltransferase [Paracoccaceae bacterium]
MTGSLQTDHPVHDAERFAAGLAVPLRALSDQREKRQLVVQALAQARREAGAAIDAAFDAHPRAARETVRARARLADATIRVAFLLAAGDLHPRHSPTEAERLTVLAVGGYGRMELAPFSDIDLLFLIPWKITPWAESVIESMLYILWDLKLKVGHASRTVKDCLRLGREDYTIRTALLEHRFLTGNEALALELRHRLRADLFRGTGPDFIEAKLAERAERHKRQGGQRYVLEPNVKEGKGGLRDLQTLYWIGKYIHGVNEAADLVAEGVFRREEYENFAAAEDFLWAVRCHLHRAAGRAVEKLSFDMQVEVAARMGYQDSAGRRAVEHFMQDYFRHATRVGELTRVFLTAMEARHLKREATLAGLLRRRRKVPAGYRIERGRLNVTDPQA